MNDKTLSLGNLTEYLIEYIQINKIYITKIVVFFVLILWCVSVNS